MPEYVCGQTVSIFVGVIDHPYYLNYKEGFQLTNSAVNKIQCVLKKDDGEALTKGILKSVRLRSKNVPTQAV